MDCSPQGSSVHGIHQARILEWVAISLSRDLPNPGIEPRSPALEADSLLTELRRKPQFPLEFLDDSDSKEFTCSAGDPGWICGSGRSPGEGNGYPLQDSCLENSMDIGALWATVHGVAKSQT